MTATADIFLSYNREDQAVARRFADAFERAGFSVWWDQALKSGIDYDKATEEALRGAKAVVVLWSKQSVGSRWVRTEATIALQNQTLVPVTIESCQRPIMFELTQTADLSHWSGDANDNVWLTFLNDVQQFVQSSASAAATKSPLTRMTGAASKRRSSALTWGLCALFALIAAGASFIALQHLRETPAPPPTPETRVDIVTPATGVPAEFALSPDGRQIVFVATGDSGVSQLWLRSLATTTAQPLAGTEGAVTPFWSPDSRSIGFFTVGSLMRMDADGGAPQTLATARVPRGGSWGADNTIVFAPEAVSNLMRVSATGGEATAVTTLAPQQQSHRYPHFLQDGRRFLFYGGGTPEIAGIYLGDLDGSAPVRLTPADSAGVFHPDGWLLWLRAGTLTAQRLDLEQATLTGDPLTLAAGVADNAMNFSALSLSTTGLIAYRTGAANGRQLTWVDRSGTVLGTIGDPDGTMNAPRVSPDGRRVAVSRYVQGNQDLWLLDGTRTSRFTFDSSMETFALWSPDGSRIVFISTRTGAGDIYQKLASGAGMEELLVGSDRDNHATSWSADGRFLLYVEISPETKADLWVMPLTGDPTPTPFLQTPFNELWGEFSPDSRWVAYLSDESGRNEIYVREFVPPSPKATADKSDAAESSAAVTSGGQWQVSTAGGSQAAWSADGRELFYVNEVGDMMAVPITVTADGFAAGTPVALFTARIVGGGGTDTGLGRQYDVAPDGRFLINRMLDDEDAPITLIQNWNPASKTSAL